MERPNRFVIRCRLPDSGAIEDAHLPDPGRLRELLLPDARVLLHPARPGRRTRWSAVLVEDPTVPGGWVSLRTTLPNDLVLRALQEGALPEFSGWDLVQPEWRHGRSRFDFLLARDDGRRLVLEVKGVSLIHDGVARFPDAVSARATRHVRELTGLVREGDHDAAILFILQREGARSVEAAAHIDPEFATALAEAGAEGVRLLGRRCRVSPGEVALGPPVPVDATGA